jgi:hypothetical protein
MAGPGAPSTYRPDAIAGPRLALRVLITDKLKSYAAAKREIMPGVEHRQHKGLNDRSKSLIRTNHHFCDCYTAGEMKP